MQTEELRMRMLGISVEEVESHTGKLRKRIIKFNNKNGRMEPVKYIHYCSKKKRWKI